MLFANEAANNAANNVWIVVATIIMTGLGTIVTTVASVIVAYFKFREQQLTTLRAIDDNTAKTEATRAEVKRTESAMVAVARHARESVRKADEVVEKSAGRREDLQRLQSQLDEANAKLTVALDTDSKLGLHGNKDGK